MKFICLLGVVAAVRYRPIEGTVPWHLDKAGIKEKQEKLPYPVDYFVPNFGPDPEMKFIKKRISMAPQWKYTPKELRPKPHPVDYFVPDFGIDKDILATQEHIADAERQFAIPSLTVQQDIDGGYYVGDSNVLVNVAKLN